MFCKILYKFFKYYCCCKACLLKLLFPLFWHYTFHKKHLNNRFFYASNKIVPNFLKFRCRYPVNVRFENSIRTLDVDDWPLCNKVVDLTRMHSTWIWLQDWGCVVLREIYFLLKTLAYGFQPFTLWRLVTWIQISMNQGKMKKAEPSRLIPQKLTVKLELWIELQEYKLANIQHVFSFSLSWFSQHVSTFLTSYFTIWILLPLDAKIYFP